MNGCSLSEEISSKRCLLGLMPISCGGSFTIGLRRKQWFSSAKVRGAINPGARLILLEELIPETPDLVPGKWIDLLMLAITGGRERTEEEYCELLLSV
jgi:hypothetical protein